MITSLFLVEWAVRSAIIIASIALLVKVLRFQDPTLRLAIWTAALSGSLLIPVLSASIPALRVPVWRARPAVAFRAAPVAHDMDAVAAPTPSPAVPKSRPNLLLVTYLLGVGTLFLRLVTGLRLSHRLIARSHPTQIEATATVRESSDISVPATFGVLGPVIMLPTDWRDWESSQLNAILAHEQSHINRRDPLWQFVSSIHRALLWFSPMSWYLHRQIVQQAEDASDDAAVAASGDRALYAEAVLQFVRRAVERVRWQGVAMARCGNADERIHRILEGTRLSNGMTRVGWLAVLALAAPMVYVCAAARPAASDEVAITSVNANDLEEQGGPINRYVIVSGNSTMSSGDRHSPALAKLRPRFAGDFAWFQQDGTDYYVTDEKVLRDIYDAMAPQRDVNRMQSVVNQKQGDVNAMQGGVNRQQGEVNRRQSEVNDAQREVNERQRNGSSDRDGQARVNAMQAEVNDLQHGVNQEQEKVNAAQAVVNGEQQKVNDEQHRVSPVIADAIQKILSDSVVNGLAHAVDLR